jgi:hypothetical protein
MVGYLLGHFQLSAILQIRRDTSRAESMIADARFDAGRFRTPANDSVGVLLEEGIGRFSFALAGFVASHRLCGGRHGYISGRYYACAPHVILDPLRDDPGISVGTGANAGLPHCISRLPRDPAQIDLSRSPASRDRHRGRVLRYAGPATRLSVDHIAFPTKAAPLVVFWLVNDRTSASVIAS